MKVEEAIEDAIDAYLIAEMPPAIKRAAFLASLRANGFEILPLAERDALRAELAAARAEFEQLSGCFEDASAELEAEREKFATLHAAYTKLRNAPIQLVGSDAALAKETPK